MKIETNYTKYMFSVKLRRWAGNVIPWLTIIIIGVFLGCEAFLLSSTIDVSRLVPISANDVFQAIILAVSLYSIGILLIKPRERTALFTLAFVLRIVIAIILSFLFQYDDERGYHFAGLKQVYGFFSWKAGHGYYHLINILYGIFGPNLLVPKVFNAFLGSLLPFFAYDLGQRFFNDPKAAWRAFWFTAFLPPLVLYSAVNLKEIATALLYVLTLWFLIVPRQYSVGKILGVGTSVSLLYWLRGVPWAAIAVTGVILYFILGESWRIKDLLRLRSCLKIILAIVLFAFFVSSFVIQPLSQMVIQRLLPGSYFIQRFTGSKATIMQFVNAQNPLSMTNLVILFLRGLFSPPPLQFLFSNNFGTILAVTNTLVWYFLFPFGMIGFWTERRKGAVVACGVIALIALVVATMGVMVGSDPYRHRIPILGLLFVLAGGGFTSVRSRQYKWVLYIWLIGIFVFTGVWIILKI